MKNDYVRGAPDLNSGGYGYGYGGYGYSDGSSGGPGYGAGGGGAPQRSFKDYLLIFRERVWYLIVAFFIVFSGSILYTFNKTKVYTAVAMVQLLRDDPSAMASAELEPNQIRSAEDLNTQISVLNSGTIVRGVERRLQDDERERFMAPYADALSFSGPLTPTDLLAKNRKVMPQRMSLMIGVGYTHPDPITAARVANLFADEFINYNLTLNIDGSMKAVEDLRIRADQQKERVEEL